MNTNYYVYGFETINIITDKSVHSKKVKRDLRLATSKINIDYFIILCSMVHNTLNNYRCIRR